ncbi:MAG TPA: GNAT family N-acetyltransferase [Flavobacterium lutivivi]|nr:GNAT family N-acetyltransferase [Flavobacterium lutivivi]
MKNYTVRLYNDTDFDLWNEFITKAKNATFLFHRNFMEYHKDRFDDYSMMVFCNDILVSVIPANRVEDKVFSHQGLTYGGFVLNKKIKLGEVIEIAKTVVKFLFDNKISKFQLKLIPSIYNDYFSEENEYCMFLMQSKLIRRDCLSVIDLKSNYLVSKTRKECIQKGIRSKVIIKEENNFEKFWSEILIPNIKLKHNSSPVHSVDEIVKLQKLFPQNIRHFNAYFNNEIVAGSTIFVTNKVAHPQYISGNSKKNEIGSLDVLYHHLITNVFKEKAYFDFGPSHENEGRNINNGILFWKESFGAKTTVQDFYEVETSNYKLLENVLI